MDAQQQRYRRIAELETSLATPANRLTSETRQLAIGGIYLQAGGLVLVALGAGGQAMGALVG